MATPLDSVDRALLALMQVDNLATSDVLAERVGRSPSVVARRLRRLRADGHIAADTAQLSEAAAGHPLSALVSIQLEKHAPEQADRLRKVLTDSPNVQLYLEVSGPFDLVILTVTRDMAAFNAFADRMLGGHPAVRRYETSFVKRRAKATLAYPLA